MTPLARIGAIRAGEETAATWAKEAVDAAERNTALNCFTTLLGTTASQAAHIIDMDPWRYPLAGLPFAAKNLFDIDGITTLAGAKINRDNPPAVADATAIRRLRSAGAVLIGATNMDEYAYGFSTENAHDGPTRNPHDLKRIAGGSSGGSAAAVAAGIVPLALGSDTNGSVRVPASLCGIYGLKPTFGRLSRHGTYPFVSSLDHVGLFARGVDEVATAYDFLQGPDEQDPSCAGRPDELTAVHLDDRGRAPVVGVLEGWFREGASDEGLEAVERVASGISGTRRVMLEGAKAARSAAFCLTGIEGASFHLDRLRQRPMDFDPAVRDRLLAGALLPGTFAVQARRVRRLFMEEAKSLFRSVDLLLAPATPCTAPKVGEAMMMIRGREIPVRANLGLYTQPISFIGLPALSVPVRMPGLPIGVQIIGPPWAELSILQAAAALERAGIVAASDVPTSARRKVEA